MGFKLVIKLSNNVIKVGIIISILLFKIFQLVNFIQNRLNLVIFSYKF